MSTPPAAPANLVGGQWKPIPGQALTSRAPANPGEIVWQGSPVLAHADEALAAARAAQPAWASWPLERRATVLRRIAELAARESPSLAALITREVGKASWDAKAEADLIAAKVGVTLDASGTGPLSRIAGYQVPIAPGRTGTCWFRPHGVVVVLGPFNFPAHLPNGHIVPALLAGNTIVFKPSDKAPAVGQALAAIIDEALRAEDAPPGVFNLVQGAADVASRLAGGDGADAVLFTGSWAVGRRIMQANLDRPGRLLALEMGGNNAAIIMPDADLAPAVVECVRSAFVSTGQRCTCTRRLIVHQDVASRVIPALVRAAQALTLGPPASGVFMGPLISDAARRDVVDAQSRFEAAGAEVLCRATVPAMDGWYLSPGVLRVPAFASPGLGTPGEDIEVFGPLLRVSVVGSLDEAIAQCNATAFGLAASLFTRDPASIDQFRARARAGCVNINTGTAGASGKLPFGGLGLSGNHRPAGAFSLDYCAVPIAGLTDQNPAPTLAPGMAFDPAWLG